MKINNFLKQLIKDNIDLSKVDNLYKGTNLDFFILRGNRYYSVSSVYTTNNGFKKLYRVEKDIVERYIKTRELIEIDLEKIK